jgi:hypothetical protein
MTDEEKARLAEEAAFAQGANDVLGIQPTAPAASESQPGTTPAATQESSNAAAPNSKPEEPPAAKADDAEGKDTNKPEDWSWTKDKFEQFNSSIEERLKSLPIVDQAAVKAQLDTELAKVFGKIGEVTRTLNELKSARPSRIDAAKLKTMANEWGPEFAASVAEDLSQAIVSDPGQSPEELEALITKHASKAVEERVKEQVEKIREEIDIVNGQRTLAAVLGRNWAQEFKGAEFESFLKTLTKERVQAFNETVDPVDYIEIHRDYKAWAAAEQAKVAAKEAERKKLEAAVTPSGDGSPPPQENEEDAFVSGFKSVRG